MARPKSEDKRASIIEAATRVIATQGLGANTALIAKEAGVATGTLFTYFATKSELFNQLYLELKTEMAEGALRSGAIQGDTWSRMELLWTGWVEWALKGPDKRRTLAQLGAGEEITASTLEAGHKIMAPVASLMDQCRRAGPLKDAPLGFVIALVGAMADTTIDYILGNPEEAEALSRTGFESLRHLLR